eukprot:1196421-Prorocentrum_minimum.AAC.5
MSLLDPVTPSCFLQSSSHAASFPSSSAPFRLLLCTSCSFRASSCAAALAPGWASTSRLPVTFSTRAKQAACTASPPSFACISYTTSFSAFAASARTCRSTERRALTPPHLRTRDTGQLGTPANKRHRRTRAQRGH